MRNILILVLTGIALQACDSMEKSSLDKSIPRLESPVEQIASLRTKRQNGRHTETIFFDHQGRVLEKFTFGQSSSKELHQYEGNQQTKSIYHYHGDSSDPGLVSIDTVTREYDSNGRLILESHVTAMIPESENRPYQSYQRHLRYKTAGDTIIKWESKTEKYDPPLADISKWERDDKNRIKRHYRLYVIGLPDAAHPDTIDHISRRFAYDNDGKLELAWYDSMYLGKYYMAPAPDTVFYRYNAQNQLSEEEHIYTSDMRNKREVDTTRLSSADREYVALSRKSFVTNRYGMSNRRTRIKYQYEKFDPIKHQKLIIP